MAEAALVVEVDYPAKDKIVVVFSSKLPILDYTAHRGFHLPPAENTDEVKNVTDVPTVEYDKELRSTSA